MDKRLIEKISKTLKEIANTANSQPPLESDFNRDIYYAYAFLQDRISYFPTEELNLEFNDQVDKILKHSDFLSKFSSKFIKNKLRGILLYCIEDSNFNIEEKLIHLITELKEFNEFSEVYLKIEGILLQKMCFELGKVKFTPGDDFLLQFLRERAERKVGIENLVYIANSFEGNLNELKGDCVAIVKVKAIPEKAYEVAKEEVGRAIDLIRYCSKILYPLNENIRFGLKGDYPRSLRRGLIFSDSSDSSILSNREFIGSPQFFEINEKSLNKIEEIGIFSLSKALQKKQATKFEELLLRTIHWFSIALTQYEAGNAFLCLIIALESLFKNPQGNSLGATVAESVAFMLYDNLEGRKKIIARMKDFYGQRSGVAHGGKKVISDSDLYYLMIIVRECISIGIKKIQDFNTQTELMNWLEEIKLS